MLRSPVKDTFCIVSFESILSAYDLKMYTGKPSNDTVYIVQYRRSIFQYSPRILFPGTQGQVTQEPYIISIRHILNGISFDILGELFGLLLG